MIDPKELRIGNLVLQKYESFPEWQPYFSEMPLSENDFKSYIDMPENLNPIPLTEEWLIKFGFEIRQTGSDNEYWQYVECKLNPQFIIGNRKGYWSFTPLWNRDYEPIKYVHQLQNLYFSLTGKELEITS